MKNKRITYKVKLGDKIIKVLFIGDSLKKIFDYYNVDYEIEE